MDSTASFSFRRGWASLEAIRAVLASAFLLLVSTGGLWGAGPQSATENQESPWEKYLVPGAPQPTFRFPVAHDHGLGSWARFCSGFLVVSHAEVIYEVLRPAENRDHSFKVPRASILEAGKWQGLGPGAAAELKFGNKIYHFYLVPAKVLDKDPHHLLTAGDVLPWPPLTQIIRGFDEVAAQIEHRSAAQEKKEAKAQPAPTPQPAEAPVDAAGPQVRVMEPAVADPTTPLEVAQPVIALRGAALDPKGVLSIQVNDHQAKLKAIGDITAIEFSVDDLKLQPGLNRVAVVATNTDHHTTRLPVLLWLRTPSAAPPAQLPAPPASSQTGTHAPAGKPLTEAEILDLLENYVPCERIASFVGRYGIDFEPTEEYFAKLRKLGAPDMLLETLRKASRSKPSSADQAR